MTTDIGMVGTNPETGKGYSLLTADTRVTIKWEDGTTEYRDNSAKIAMSQKGTALAVSGFPIIDYRGEFEDVPECGELFGSASLVNDLRWQEDVRCVRMLNMLQGNCEYVPSRYIFVGNSRGLGDAVYHVAENGAVRSFGNTTDGSGGSKARFVLDCHLSIDGKRTEEVKPRLPMTESLEIMLEALRHASFNDDYTGGYADALVCTEDGMRLYEHVMKLGDPHGISADQAISEMFSGEHDDRVDLLDVIRLSTGKYQETHVRELLRTGNPLTVASALPHVDTDHIPLLLDVVLDSNDPRLVEEAAMGLYGKSDGGYILEVNRFLAERGVEPEALMSTRRPGSAY